MDSVKPVPRSGGTAACLSGYSQTVLQRKPAAFCIANQIFDVAATHQRTDHVRLPVLFAEIEDGHDVRVVAKPGHRLRLARYPLA